MQPYHPKAPSRAENLIALLRVREDDKLSRDAANEIERLRTQEYRLARRIHQQRVALRENWEIVEMRASHRRAWVRSPLLRDMLKRGTKPRTSLFWNAFWETLTLQVLWRRHPQ